MAQKKHPRHYIIIISSSAAEIRALLNESQPNFAALYRSGLDQSPIDNTKRGIFMFSGSQSVSHHLLEILYCVESIVLTNN